MNGQEIIQKFELYTDDSTELSSAEELALANSKLRVIYQEQPWEFLRKNATGSIASDGTITLPTDFDHPMVNYTDDPTSDLPDQAVVLVGAGKTPYRFIPMGSRKSYIGNEAVCWVNLVSGKIEFPSGAGGQTYDFDYKYKPTDITTSTSPVLPSDFHEMVVSLMLIDDDIIQKVEKARANITENNSKYLKFLSNLKSWNSKFWFR